MTRLLAILLAIAAVLVPAAIDARGFTGQRRALISDADWAHKIRTGQAATLKGFDRGQLAELV